MYTISVTTVYLRLYFSRSSHLFLMTKKFKFQLISQEYHHLIVTPA